MNIGNHLLATLSVSLIFVTGCERFSNAFNKIQHTCGISDWDAKKEEKAFFKLISPNGGSVNPELLGLSTFTTSDGEKTSLIPVLEFQSSQVTA